MRQNVLIYPGNAFSSIQVYKCLQYSLRYRPILGNHGFTHGEYVTKDCFTDLPLITDHDFVDRMNEFIEEEQISFIVPAHDTVCNELMKIEEQIKAKIVCSPYETTSICRHKKDTYSYFEGSDFIPITYNAINSILPDEFPVFVKDDIGQGGKRAFKAESYQQLLDGINRNPNIDYVISEYLPGVEITIDCFTDRHGELLFYQPRERVTILSGMSGLARTIETTEEIEEICKEINKRLTFRGYWYIQCRKDKLGKYKLMEVSCRFSGTFCLSANLDVNLPLLALTDAEGLDVRVVPNKYDISGNRWYEMKYKIPIEYSNVYFDFDDTLVFDRKKYNPVAFAFLLQCKNEGKKIFLITRHSYNIHETLTNLSISESLFDQIIEVPAKESKADYIQSNSILIDNSFKDRLEVKEFCAINTFDVSNIEALLE